MNNSNQKYILLFLVILIIISVVVFFVFYKKDEEESNPSPSPSNQGNSSSPSPSPSKEDKVSVKITDDGVYIPDLPTKENYTTNEMPCDEIYDEDKDDGSLIPIPDATKEWCEDLGIPINQKYAVIGYSYDDSIDLTSSSSFHPDSIYKKHKDLGCVYGDDKKRCVYIEKRNIDGNVIGIENKYGENLLEIFWDDLTSHTKMRNFFTESILNNMEIKIEKVGKDNKLYIRPKPTSRNCAEFTGEWFVMKPGVNMPTVIGVQLTMLFLHIKGYTKDLVTFDINIKASSPEDISKAEKEEMDLLKKDPNDDGEDMCTDDIVYDEDSDDDNFVSTSTIPPTGTSQGTVVGGTSSTSSG